MKIAIAERLHPFSHCPGTRCLLPRSAWQVQVFPALLRFQSLLRPEQEKEVRLSIVGPMQEFTVEMDLEKGVIRVFGKTARGYVRYQIGAQKEGIALVFDKTPEGGVGCDASLLLPWEEKELVPLSQERLSLGMHKAQDWDLVRRRQDLKELFPIWMRIGQMTPCPLQSLTPVGTLRLLLHCQEVVARKEILSLVPQFLQLFQTAFSGICVPRLIDAEYQGILPCDEIIPHDATPLPILTQGAELIRSLFFLEKKAGCALLPCLVPEFASGRFIGIRTAEQHQLALEWSKHRLKKVIIQPSQEGGRVNLLFPKGVRSFRMRSALQEKGKICQVIAGSAMVELKREKTFYLDRFEK